MKAGKSEMTESAINRQELSDTLPKLLLRNSLKFGDSKIALREKDRGIWKSQTWKNYYETVSQLAMALDAMGLRKGDKVAIIGENKPHTYWFEMASLSCGAIVLGIFSDCSSDETNYFLNHSDASFVVCQDQEQVDKILAIKSEISNVKKVIYWEERGLWNYKDSLLLTMKEMLKTGRELLRNKEGLVEEMIRQTNPEDPAVLFYSSGTRDLPQAAVQTHGNILRMVALMDRRHPVFDTDESVSFLPIAWTAEQLFNVAYSLWKGFTVNFPEKQETVQEDMRAVGPHILLLPPRLWEEISRTVRVKISEASWFFGAAMRVMYRAGDAEMKGTSIGIQWKLLHAMVDFCIFRPLRDRFGLSRVRIAYTTGMAVSPDIIRHFHAIGVPLVQLYGSSESGVVSIHSRKKVKPETCGTALDGCEITLSRSGEILIKSDHMFKGYHKDPEKTTHALRGGVYHTGDFGRFDADGHLIVTGPMDELQKMGEAREFSPQSAETRLRFSPYIKDALVIGRKSHGKTIALVNIDYSNVCHWAEKRRIVYTTFADLSRKAEVIELVRKEISMVNARLPEGARIGQFLNLQKEFDPDEFEMTRTRKLRRNFVEKKHQRLIEALLAEKKTDEVTDSIVYRDGIGEISEMDVDAVDA
jgi:long-chain acyl-CoA synthetase